MKLDLKEDLQQQMIAISVLDMLERGEKVHDIADVTQKIVGEVWYGYIAQQMKRRDEEK